MKEVLKSEIRKIVNSYNIKAVRDAHMAEIAAQHRAAASERQRIREAVAEVLALESVEPDNIDDVLAQVSTALGIELPTDTDRADICQRGHKSIADLKRELGSSLWAERMAAHEKDRFAHKAKTDRYAKLIKDFSNSVVSHQQAMGTTNDEAEWVATFDTMIDSRNRLYEAFATVTDYAAELVAKYTPVIDIKAENARTSEDFLNDNVLDCAWKAANDSFDAGRTLDQLGWSHPSGEPPDRPHGVPSIAEIVRRAAA